MKCSFYDNVVLVDEKKISKRKLALMNIGDIVYLKNDWYVIIEKRICLEHDEISFSVERKYNDR